MLTFSKKYLPILILNILKKYSDEDHPLKQAQIISKIKNLYDIDCERKSITSNVEALRELGFDIIKTSDGIYLGARELEPSEIQFLIDAVFSSRSIDCKHSKELANKLSSFLSVNKRKQYNYLFKSDEINRSDNKQLFYTIDVLNEAIEKGKQVQFSYEKFYYKSNNKKGKRYKINPYFLINNQGRYYLVSNNDYFNDIANFKVDRIRDIVILDTPVKDIKKVEGCENGIDIAKYANENIYMFSTKSIKCTLKIHNDFISPYVEDWFGKNARFYEKDNEIYAEVYANEDSLLYWALQYGEMVEVVSPTSLIDRIKKILHIMNARYK